MSYPLPTIKISLPTPPKHDEPPITYLDAAAAAPLAPEAFAAMKESLMRAGNPGATHAAGRFAKLAVEDARGRVAALLNVGEAAVTFTSTATEANNLAMGVSAYGGRDVLVSSVEHDSVLSPARATGEKPGAQVVRVQSSGEVDLEDLERALATDHEPALVSIQAANNETGVIQPLVQIAEIVHSAGALFHTDASQLLAWGSFDALDHADLVTVSSHKMYGPQGAAALIARPEARGLLRPVLLGGGQERGLRSGTANVAALSGFGVAADLARVSGSVAAKRVAQLRERLTAGLLERIPHAVIHGASAAFRLPGILNIAVGVDVEDFPESDALLARLPTVAASSGSACHAGTPEPSRVLRAMGISDLIASRSVRLSLSRYSTNEEVTTAVDEISTAYRDLVEMINLA